MIFLGCRLFWTEGSPNVESYVGTSLDSSAEYRTSFGTSTERGQNVLLVVGQDSAGRWYEVIDLKYKKYYDYNYLSSATIITML